MRRVAGWLNVDLVNSELNVDLASELPWRADQFDAVVCQHVIEHLEIHRELLPLLKEVRRVCRPGAEVWLSTPDMARVCAEYQSSRGKALITDRQRRFPKWDICRDGLPTSHVINHFFHQDGEHTNLFDFELLSWVLQECGFEGIQRVTEADLLSRFPEFPVRDDDWVSLYVRAVA